MTDLDPAVPTYAPEALADLSPDALADRLIADHALAPRTLIDACAARGDAIVDVLRRRLDHDDAWVPDGADAAWWLRLHAIMILGLVPTGDAGDLLATLMRRMTAAGDTDLEDWTGGVWPALFANKPQTAIDAVEALMTDPGVAFWTRVEAAAVVLDHARRDPDALERQLDRLASIAAASGADPVFSALLCNLLIEFPRARHRRLVELWAARQSGEDAAVYDRRDVRRAYARGRDAPGWLEQDDPWRMYAPGVVARRLDEIEEAREAEDAAYPDPDGSPYVREEAKVGRNDPCPCGSGRKYKKCCLAGREA